MVRELWFISAVLAGAIALLVVELPSPTRNFDLFVNALHAPAFAALTLVLLRSFLKSMSRNKAILTAAVACLAVGLASEVLQVWGSRDADILDLINDGIGVATGIGLWWVLWAKGRPAGHEGFRLVVLLLVPLLALTLAPAAWYGYAAVSQQRAMPKLLSFDKKWEMPLYRASFDARLELEEAPDNWPISASRVIKIIATGSHYPGITIQPTANWEDYETLKFYAASASNLPARLTISIYDDDTNRDYTNRFNYSFSIGSDPRLITIPLSDVKSAPKTREMNMRAIKEIVIFISNANGSEVVLLDDLRLSPH